MRSGASGLVERQIPTVGIKFGSTWRTFIQNERTDVMQVPEHRSVRTTVDRPSRPWRLWTYRWRVALPEGTYVVRLESGLTTNVFAVAVDGADLVSEALNFYQEEFRLQELRLPVDGGELIFQTAPRNWYSYGLRVSRDGETVFESHPEPFAMLSTLKAIATFGSSDAGKVQRERGREFLPAIAADISLAFILYIAAGYMSLRDTALLGVGIGLSLHVVQWALDRLAARKINLTGGLSTFAIAMLALSAATAWLLQSDLAIQLKPTVLGLVGAAILIVDGWLGGPYLGRRMARYITFMDIDPQRMSLASGLVAVVMALLNGVVALGMSRDAWLLYKYWVSPALGIGLGLYALVKSRKPKSAQT